jgi:predicted enzyme related to lactoylglutathione lyase
MTQNAGPWPGRFVWHDLMTTDGAKAQAFYASLFDWQVQEVPMQGCVYRMVHCGPGPIGGIVEEKAIPVSHWMPYLAVENVDAAAAKVTELGGSVCVPPTDIPQTGRFSVVADPTGAYFSLYTGLPGSEGADPNLPVPGRVCWNETYSTDDDKAQAFYTALVGWQAQPLDMGPAGIYRVQMLGDKQAGGLMKHPMPGMPSCWVVYFFVEDLAAATQKAKGLGASAMMEMIPIPNVGQFSMLTDPTGAMFALFQASPALASGSCN